ncbi:MAG TPA: apolipoprotein N-acyltransferase [Acidobacteriaceae bacterium]|nr:apolipoprotein N-acyltransferase [Acidobacteriaceae bacterium]
MGFAILLALLTSALLDFCFPVAGPMPPWRSLLAFVALVPLLYALLNDRFAAHPRYLRRAALVGYASGVLWYILNCYWIYQTMLCYGHVPPPGAAGIVVLFALVLGLYFGLLAFLLAFFRRRFGLTWGLVLAPFLWTAIDLAAARVTSVPWDQLGYSQVDHPALTAIAPITGVYGVTFLLVAGNALFAALWMTRKPLSASVRTILTALAFASLWLLGRWTVAPAPTSAYAVLLQPNIDVEPPDNWIGPEWQGNISWLTSAAAQTCTPAYSGMPQPNTAPPDQTCPQNTPPPGIVLWPEVGSWMQSDDPRTLALLRTVATSAHAPFIAGMIGQDSRGTYNSAVFVQPDGAVAGRYDKIHLVPFGEYVPYRDLFFFAHHLTRQVGDFTRGRSRTPVQLQTPTGPHTFGVFICYESVFGDEVRHFALNGAQVLVNLSDDGWYGDTSAPWQHLNMARMRAIENRRWILRDTNNGVTTVIDPWGRVTFSAPRHTLTSLTARYGTLTDLTFYTRHGDLFAWLCSLITLAALAAAVRRKSASSQAQNRPVA